MTTTPDFVTLSCPTCGARLQITSDMDRFACIHCGNEHIVQRQGGAVMLAPVVEGLRQVQTGVDKTAAELAIARLSKEIAAQQAALEAIDAEPVQDPIAERRFMWAIVGSILLGAAGAANNAAWLLVLVPLIVIAYIVYCFPDERKRRADRNERRMQSEIRIADLDEQLRHHRRLVNEH